MCWSHRNCIIGCKSEEISWCIVAFVENRWMLKDWWWHFDFFLRDSFERSDFRMRRLSWTHRIVAVIVRGLKWIVLWDPECLGCVFRQWLLAACMWNLIFTDVIFWMMEILCSFVIEAELWYILGVFFHRQEVIFFNVINKITRSNHTHRLIAHFRDNLDFF